MIQSAEEYKALRQLLLDRDGQTCHYCGRWVLLPHEARARLHALESADKHRSAVNHERVMAGYTARRYRLPSMHTLVWREQLAIDHKVPRADGGTDDPANLVIACNRCNAAKGVQPYEWFVEYAQRWRTAVTAEPWTPAAAAGRAARDTILQQALLEEPRLVPIITAAQQQQNQPGYHRIDTYTILRDRAIPLVGWKAANPALRTQQHYYAVIRAIDDLLPPDDVDLFPNGPVGASYK